MNIGIYENLTNHDYHAAKDFISRSSLMDFDKSPHTYWAKHLNPGRPTFEPTPSMMLGSAFHTLILEPELFNDNYIIAPKKVLLKDVGKKDYEEYKNLCAKIETDSRIVLSTDDYVNLLSMQQQLNLSNSAKELLKDAKIEHSFFWKDPNSGLHLKCRPDALQDNIIIDLKTTSDASPRNFQHEMVKYGYHIQFAMIREAIEILTGKRICNFVNIVIENKYPHNTAIYLIDEAAVDAGELKYKELCMQLKQAQIDQVYKDYGIQQIGLPRWAI